MKYVLSLFLSICMAVSLYAKSEEVGQNIDVNHYEIHLNEINIEERTLNASTTITLTSLTSIEFLQLELKSLSVTSVTSDDVSIEDFSQEGDIFTINLSSAVEENTTLSITINYGGSTFNENWGGIHWSNDYVYNLGVGFDSQPHNLGKTWFPCVDNFTDKASYDLFITYPDNMLSSCGGLLNATTNNNDGTKTDHWVVSQEIATYLMSFAIGDFILWEDVYHGMERDIPINVYAKSNQIDKVEATFANTKAIAAIFEEKFGPYPHNRIAYVSTGLGCMEHVDNIALSSSLITGTTNLNSDYFISHEMSHSWFGNKVTCSTAGDMWLNEGFATFCNYYYFTEMYDEATYLEAMDAMIDDIVMSCHQSEGWIPLNNMPLDLTYGTTVYDKGAITVHTMMNYLGRETFDEAIRYYLNKFDSKSASSEDLRDAITECTGIDMSDFFETWVFTPGSPAYNVQYFTVEPNGDKFDVQINMNQKHRASDHIGNSVVYEISFVDEDWNLYSEKVSWDGESAVVTKTLDFEPVAIFCDYDNKFADASHEETYVINSTGSKEFSKAKFKAIVEEISDSTLLRIEHRWVGPKSVGEIPEGLTISPDRYWTIHRLDKGEATIKGEFQYQDAANYDDNLIVSPNDSIVLLYRPDGSAMWQSLDYVFQGMSNYGRMTVDNIQSGDYVLGMWDEEHADVNEINNNSNIKIYPNPAEGIINIELGKEIKGKIVITNQLGQTVKEVKINDDRMTLNIDELTSGIYFVNVMSKKNVIYSEKIIMN
ncbi:MAG: T9SS type A sorting domain-containing protein [Bacteroidales bacterium]|nr:T9SS type A sorting domain-containing protein [Bacteroidales bacterium]